MRALTIVAFFCFTGVVVAEEKKSDENKPAGAWVKKADSFEIKFAFKKDDVMVFTMTNSNENCEMKSKCTYGKDGAVKCKVTKFTKNGNFPDIEEGFEFSFKIVAKDKMAKITDLEAKGVDEAAKSLVEGDYEKATD
jgi:hypothetical protein